MAPVMVGWSGASGGFGTKVRSPFRPLIVKLVKRRDSDVVPGILQHGIGRIVVILSQRSEEISLGLYGQVLISPVTHLLVQAIVFHLLTLGVFLGVPVSQVERVFVASLPLGVPPTVLLLFLGGRNPLGRCFGIERLDREIADFRRNRFVLRHLLPFMSVA